MAIVIILGNVGSGKTASVVRQILKSPHKKYISNIITKGVKNNRVISPEMIIKKQVTGYKKKRDGTSEEITKKVLNHEFWKSINEPVDVILDEAHTILNSRRAMSKTNIIMTEWLALLRRVLGQSSAGEGNLYLITQLPNRIDNIARDMATQVRFHRSHFKKTCKKCKYTWQESNETPDQLFLCPACNHHHIKKHDLKIEVMYFQSMNDYLIGVPPYKHILINDIETVFKHYNTLQWDNLMSDLY